MKAVAAWAALALAVLWHQPASADDSKAIDCGETDLKFDQPGYTTKCYDFSNASMGVGDQLAARKTQELYAYSDADRVFIDVIDNRTLGDRIYLLRRDLEADVEGYFDRVTDKNWTPGSPASGFEIAEFDGGPKDQAAMECIGFRRDVNQHAQGLGRIVVGLACSAAGRRKAYDALKHLIAPGA